MLIRSLSISRGDIARQPRRSVGDGKGKRSRPICNKRRAPRAKTGRWPGVELRGEQNESTWGTGDRHPRGVAKNLEINRGSPRRYRWLRRITHSPWISFTVQDIRRVRQI